MNIKILAEELEPYIIERRRFYHRIPELAGMEAETTRAIAEDLTAMGLEPVLFSHHTGLTAVIRGSCPGKTLMLRADIDGLKGEETTGLPFSSANGCMHACGHDCHIAMQLGAARILAEHRDEFQGNVKLLFQPAEEISAGAGWVIEEGAMKNVDAVYGTHIWGTLPAPMMDITSGYRMAASNRFHIVLKGTAAHGAMPHLGRDAVTAACSLVMNLQLLVTRFNCATEPVVLTVGMIHGGSQYNSLADRVELDGSVRHFRRDHKIEEEMRRMIRGTAEAMDVDWEFDYDYINVPVVNDHEELNRICKNAAVQLYGEGCLAEMPMLMSSEDYSLLMREVPGIFTFIGASNPEKGITASNHQSCFTVDESVLKRGAALAAQFAVDFLNQENDQ